MRRTFWPMSGRGCSGSRASSSSLGGGVVTVSILFWRDEARSILPASMISAIVVSDTNAAALQFSIVSSHLFRNRYLSCCCLLRGVDRIPAADLSDHIQTMPGGSAGADGKVVFLLIIT